uniref:MFS transporter n=1 Tax=Aggregatilinea sp. TaxID=2806333 RepID=UPI002BBB29F1
MNPDTETTAVPAHDRPAGAGLRVELVALTLARTVLNTSHRMIYPFLPTIARGLAVSETAVALTVTGRSSLGLIGPLIGSLADRRGRKVAMITGMLIFSAGLALVGLWPTYPALFAGVLLAGVSKLLFDPALHAYLGDRVDYARRGMAVALAEMSWSAAFLVGMPVVAWLIARSDHWYAPFPWLAALGAIFAVVLWRVLPNDAPFHIDRPSLLDGARTVLAHRSARAGLGVSLLITAANETVSIMFGVWLEDAFAMKVAALGLASVVIGVAELGGE